MKRAVVFDLDGTLVRSPLDFDRIRRELGVEGPVLEAIARLEEPLRGHAWRVLREHERRAAAEAVCQPQASEVLARLRREGFALAVLTRNGADTTRMILSSLNLRMDAVRTRDDGAIKPAAEPLLSILDELRVPAARAWMVGDYLFDLQCGRAAGVRTVLVLHGKPRPPFADLADHVIAGLEELPALLSGS